MGTRVRHRTLVRSKSIVRCLTTGRDLRRSRNQSRPLMNRKPDPLFRRTGIAVSLALLIVCAGSIIGAQQDHKRWTDYGGGLDSSHFVALEQIDKSNVKDLEIAWTYPTGDNRSYLFNPIVVDGIMYVLAR